jgi:scyllo-inositol 2-dehydrogenase (NADP+)
MMMTEKLRFAVIGCGRMGVRRMKSITSHSQTKLVCLSDNDEVAAKKFSKEMGCDFYPDWEKAVGRPDVDFVVVSVPNKLHNPIVTEALKQGKHVWCEKPLARNPEEAFSIVKAAAKTERFLKVGSNLRYFPSVQKAKQLLDSSAIGESYFLEVGWATQVGRRRCGSPMPSCRVEGPFSITVAICWIFHDGLWARHGNVWDKFPPCIGK